MTMFRISAKILGWQFWIWNTWEGKPLHESPLSPIVPPCAGEIKHDLWLGKFKMANLAWKGSRKWNKSCDWSNNGKECCSVVSSRFFGVGVAWHPKKRLRRRLIWRQMYIFLIVPGNWRCHAAVTQCDSFYRVCVHCHAIENKFKNNASDKVRKMWYCMR